MFKNKAGLGYGLVGVERSACKGACPRLVPLLSGHVERFAGLSGYGAANGSTIP
jgi:hypothetical protein